MLRSTDYYQARMSFQDVSIPTWKTITALSFLTPALGFAAANDGSIYVMTDGSTWTALGAAPTPVVDLAYASSLVGWAAGPNGIFRTSDGGWTWQAETPAVPIDGLDFDAGVGCAAGDHNLLLDYLG